MSSPQPPTERQGVFERIEAENVDAFAPQDWALFLGISALWGASFLLIAYALEGLTPGVVTLARVGCGSIPLWILRLAMYRGERIAPEDRRRVVLLALVWLAVPFSLFPLAQQWINSAVTGLLNGGTPVLVALVSVFFVKVVPKPRQILGLILGFIGIVLISIGAAGEGTSQLKGVLLVLGAVTCYGFAINMASPLQARYGPIVLTSSLLSIATVMVLPLALVNFGDNEWDAAPVSAALVLGVLGTGFAYWIMASLVGRVGAVRSSFITYLIPVVSLALGVWLRNDEVAPITLLGLPVTIAGAFIASRSAR